MNLDLDGISLRPAVDDDYVSFWRIHRAAVREHVEATWGWDEDWQMNRFRERWKLDGRDAIVAAGRSVGLLAVDDRPEAIHIDAIEIEPAHQGRGTGTAIVSAILADGRARGVPVRLQVLKVNRARRLYERLGFDVVAETDTHVEMQALPG